MSRIPSPLDLDSIVSAIRGANADLAKATESTRRAAVAAVLRRPVSGAEAEVLFIKRAEHEGDPWSGHMAFPGGRQDPQDATALHTATRETREELGLDLEAHAELIGPLEPIEAVARGRRVGMCISPFVFQLDVTPSLEPNHEVAEVLWAPLGPLLRGEHDTKKRYVFENRTLYLPGYDVNGRIVWGLTYQMLQNLKRVLGL